MNFSLNIWLQIPSSRVLEKEILSFTLKILFPSTVPKLNILNPFQRPRSLANQENFKQFQKEK